MSQSDDDEAQIRLAAFGRQVDMFCSSDVGKYLLGCAETQAAESASLLKKCDPYDSMLVQSLQNKILVADSFRSWLREAVTSGLQALNIIEERHENE